MLVLALLAQLLVVMEDALDLVAVLLLLDSGLLLQGFLLLLLDAGPECGLGPLAALEFEFHGRFVVVLEEFWLWLLDVGPLRLDRCLGRHLLGLLKIFSTILEEKHVFA